MSQNNKHASIIISKELFNELRLSKANFAVNTKYSESLKSNDLISFLSWILRNKSELFFEYRKSLNKDTILSKK